MLLSHISASLIVLGFLSTAHAAPIVPLGNLNQLDRDPVQSPTHQQVASFVEYKSAKVFGPFVKLVNFPDHEPDPEGPFTSTQAGVPMEAMKTINYIFDYLSFHPNSEDSTPPPLLQFSARWPDHETNPHVRGQYYGRAEHNPNKHVPASGSLSLPAFHCGKNC
ncbi:hypothetical protein EV361DRAFT_913098 [Lentinula raphanica]|nr:hypothetical protein EV361DRAFT_913098 [Lentinula raphanica]